MIKRTIGNLWKREQIGNLWENDFFSPIWNIKNYAYNCYGL